MSFAIFEGKYTEVYIVVDKSSVIYLTSDKESFAVFEGKHTEVYIVVDESPVIYSVGGDKKSFAVFEGKHTEGLFAAQELRHLLGGGRQEELCRL